MRINWLVMWLNFFSSVFLVSPIFAWMIFGAFLRFFKVLNRRRHQNLSKLTFNILIPVMLFYGTYSAENIRQLNFNLLLAFYLPVMLVFFASFTWFKQTRQLHPSTLAMSACYSNNVLVGIPILLQVVGEKILLPAFIIISVHTLILFSLALWFQVVERGNKSMKPLFETLKNPIVFSLILGVLANVAGIEVFALAESVMAITKWLAIPCALIILGSSLVTFGLSGQWRIATQISLVKLIVLPTMIWLAAKYIFQLEAWICITLAILAASPVGVNAFGFAEKERKQPKTIGAAVLVSTIASLLTQTVWLALLG